MCDYGDYLKSKVTYCNPKAVKVMTKVSKTITFNIMMCQARHSQAPDVAMTTGVRGGIPRGGYKEVTHARNQMSHIYPLGVSRNHGNLN